MKKRIKEQQENMGIRVNMLRALSKYKKIMGITKAKLKVQSVNQIKNVLS